MRVIFRLVLVFALSLTALTAAQAQMPSYVVFFQEWSAAIDGPAQDVVNQAAAWIKDHPGRPTRVIGYCDPTGSRDANILLSELRAQVIADALIKAGAAPAMISKVGRGSVRFASTALESRRVEIAIPR